MFPMASWATCDGKPLISWDSSLRASGRAPYNICLRRSNLRMGAHMIEGAAFLSSLHTRAWHMKGSNSKQCRETERRLEFRISFGLYLLPAPCRSNLGPANSVPEFSRFSSYDPVVVLEDRHQQ